MLQSKDNEMAHRDIKTGNIIVNTHTQQVTVIDWDLAEFYIKGHG